MRPARRPPLASVALVGLGLALALPVRAIILYSTADPDQNAQPPTGALAGSGWQWVGQLGGFHGVPIGPHHFITAAHVGSVTPGTPFVFDGVSYPTIQSNRDPISDLLIWRVEGTFPGHAPLYRASNELGRPLVVFGRGKTRGEPATNTLGALGGWKHGLRDGRLRWGTNVVSTVDEAAGLLIAEFNANGGAEEAHLGDGDSSGPVFIRDPADGIWKLAGINYGVEASFNNLTPPDGGGFSAALFDKGGFWMGGPGNWQWIADAPTNIPSRFAASRISSRVSWIESVVPPTVADVPLLAPWHETALTVLLGALAVVHLNGGRPRIRA
jgi:hypothetical protein